MVAEVTENTDLFTDDETNAIARFLKYPHWQGLAQSIQLGYPATSQPMYLLFDSLQRITPAARGRVRLDLRRCLCLEEQLFSSASRVRASQVGTVKLNPREFMDVQIRIDYFAKRIADILGVVFNPFSEFENAGTPGGINATRVGG